MLRSAVKALKTRGIRAVSGHDITRPAAVADVSEYAAVQADQPIHAAHGKADRTNICAELLFNS